MFKKPEVLISNWQTYVCPLGHIHLHGIINGHPNKTRVPENRLAWTSPIIEFDEENGFCETKNTLYSLDGPRTIELLPSTSRICP